MHLSPRNCIRTLDRLTFHWKLTLASQLSVRTKDAQLAFKNEFPDNVDQAPGWWDFFVFWGFTSVSLLTSSCNHGTTYLQVHENKSSACALWGTVQEQYDIVRWYSISSDTALLQCPGKHIQEIPLSDHCQKLIAMSTPNLAVYYIHALAPFRSGFWWIFAGRGVDPDKLQNLQKHRQRDLCPECRAAVSSSFGKILLCRIFESDSL